MNYLKLFFLSLLVATSTVFGKNLREYQALVEKYKNIHIEISSDFKTKLRSTNSKLEVLGEILNAVELDNIFATDPRRVANINPEQNSIMVHLFTNQLGLTQIKESYRNLESDKRAFERVKPVYDLKDAILEKIDIARKVTTKIGDYASGTFMAYGLYDILYNPLKVGLKEFYNKPSLILESKASLMQKSATILAMLAITCHYVGK